MNKSIDTLSSDKVFSSRKDNFWGLSYQIGVSVFSKMIAFASLYLYANLLPSDQISKIAVLQAMVVGLVTLLSLQLPAALFRYSIQIANIKSSLWLANKSSIIMFFSFAAIPAVLYLDDSLIGMALILSLAQIATFFKLEVIRAVDATGKYFSIIFLQIIFSVLLTIITLSFFGRGNGVLVYAGFEFASWVMAFSVASVIVKGCQKEHKPIFIKSEIVLYLKYGVFLIPTAMSWWLITQAPILISGYILASEDVAMYAISNRMPNMVAIIAFIVPPIVSKNLALIYEVDPYQFGKKFIIYSAYWCAAFLFMSIMIFIINFIFLVSWYPEYVVGFTTQLLQVVNAYFIAVFSFLSYAYIVTKKVKYSSVASVVGGFIGVFCSYIFGVKFGLIGVISGMTVGIVIGLILIIFHITGFFFEKNNDSFFHP